MRHQHRFTETAPVIDLSRFQKDCGHQLHEDCRCRTNPFPRDPDYERWVDQLELAGEDR